MPGHVVNMAVPIRFGPQRRPEGLIWRIVDTGVSLLTNSYPTEPGALPGLIVQGVQAVLGVPVRVGDQVLGALFIYRRRREPPFAAHNLATLETIGRQAGVAIRNARLYEAAVRESSRRALLYQASVAFGGTLAANELYAVIHRAVRQLMPCDSIAIALFYAVEHEVEYVYVADKEAHWSGRRMALGRGLLSYVIREGITLRINGSEPEIEALFGAERFDPDAPVTRAILAVPLRAGEHMVGAFTVQALRPDAYDSEDLDALEMLAATAAIAIQNAQLFAKVQELATTDPLTGVFNRRHFFELARRELERAARYHHPLSLLMLDADFFKQINDTYGHIAGDQVLQAIAARCRETVREVDVVARYGGEEFLVLLPETNPSAAMQVAERLRERVEREPMLTEAGPVQASISVGVACYEPTAPRSIEQLLDLVDKALYVAKRAGRNQIHAFESA
jgi:diguanylate cyclase (GGDEF)-like protein